MTANWHLPESFNIKLDKILPPISCVDSKKREESKNYSMTIKFEEPKKVLRVKFSSSFHTINFIIECISSQLRMSEFNKNVAWKFLYVCLFALTITFSIITFHFIDIRISFNIKIAPCLANKESEMQQQQIRSWVSSYTLRNYWINFQCRWLLICIRLLICSSRQKIARRRMMKFETGEMWDYLRI
jgi:hypothetical protein